MMTNTEEVRRETLKYGYKPQNRLDAEGDWLTVSCRVSWTWTNFNLKMEVARSYEMLTSYIITRRHNPVDQDEIPTLRVQLTNTEFIWP